MKKNTQAQQKKVSFAMNFLKTMLGMLRNEQVVLELTKVISAYEKMHETTVTKEENLVGSEISIGKIEEQSLIVKDVKQVSKKPKIS